MRKYAIQLTGSKTIAREMVNHCRDQYNRPLAWVNKARARRTHQEVIKTYFHNWLYERALPVIKERSNANYSKNSFIIRNQNQPPCIN